ncbi:MAG: Nucleoid occlusion factor SlmA [Phycisphaerae bacterium]|nr:Nucleoid occlusion factor SlmA [Phycisphaerae bacterium]
MPRPNMSVERRAALLPLVARAFAQLGYRRTTTAALAERCGVQESVLYRLWPGKKQMFIAAIEYVFELSASVWRRLSASGGGAASARRILDYESRHYGELGHYRIIFAGLSETDDPDVHDALRTLFGRYQRFLREQIDASRGTGKRHGALGSEWAAWALVGLGLAASVSRELTLLSDADRTRLIAAAGGNLLSAAGG